MDTAGRVSERWQIWKAWSPALSRWVVWGERPIGRQPYAGLQVLVGEVNGLEAAVSARMLIGGET